MQKETTQKPQKKVAVPGNTALAVCSVYLFILAPSFKARMS